VQEGGWEEGDVSKHLVEAVDMAVGDMRLTTLMARCVRVPRFEGRMRSCPVFDMKVRVIGKVRVKGA